MSGSLDGDAALETDSSEKLLGDYTPSEAHMQCTKCKARVAARVWQLVSWTLCMVLASCLIIALVKLEMAQPMDGYWRASEFSMCARHPIHHVLNSLTLTRDGHERASQRVQAGSLRRNAEVQLEPQGISPYHGPTIRWTAESTDRSGLERLARRYVSRSASPRTC